MHTLGLINGAFKLRVKGRKEERQKRKRRKEDREIKRRKKRMSRFLFFFSMGS